MAKNGQGLIHKFVHTSLFTLKNYIIPTSYDLANMRYDCYSCTTWVNKVGTYYVSLFTRLQKIGQIVRHKTQTDTRVMRIFYRSG